MISIVIPNYNGADHLPACIGSLMLQSFREFKVVVVDNCSTDNSMEFVKTIFPEVKTIELNSNYGFAKAINAGIKWSLADNEIKYILLLNNDTECNLNFLEELIKGIKPEGTGSTACKLLNFYKRDLIDAAGDFIKLGGGSPYARGHGENDNGQYDYEEFIFGASGAAAMYKRDVFETIGLFDEDYYAFYEDVDFNLRMQLAGYKCMYIPSAICYHKRGASFNKQEGYEIKLRERNLVYLRIKNYPLNFLFRYSPVFCFARIKRFYQYLKEESFFIFINAVKGYIKGVITIPKMLKKRWEITKIRKISAENLRKLI